MYRIESHLHTKYISVCGWLEAEELAKRYHEAGYHALAVTDHYNVDTWLRLGIDARQIRDVMPQFTEGFQRLEQAAAKYDMPVYLGAEVRFYENQNDYLLFGFDPALLAQPHEVMSMGAVAFSEYARKAGAVMIQAHPFRTGCIPLDPVFVDGIEIYNANPRHNNHNDRAQALAERQAPSFLRTAGSDCHRPEDIGLSGLLSPTLPANAKEFADLLRAQTFSPIIPTEQAR